MDLLPAFISALLTLHVCFMKDGEGVGYIIVWSVQDNGWRSVSQLSLNNSALLATWSSQLYLRARAPHFWFWLAYLNHSMAMPFLLIPIVSLLVDLERVETLFSQHAYLPPSNTQGRCPHRTVTSEQHSPHFRPVLCTRVKSWCCHWKLEEIGPQSRPRKSSSCPAPPESVLPRVDPPGGLKLCELPQCWKYVTGVQRLNSEPRLHGFKLSVPHLSPLAQKIESR